MAGFKFTIEADYKKIVQLRDEIAQLESQIRGMGDAKGIDKMLGRLNSKTKEFDNLVVKTAKAQHAMSSMSSASSGAMEAIAQSAKANLRIAEVEVDKYARKILEQKALIKDIERDVSARKKSVTNAFGMAKTPALNEYNAAVKALNEEKSALVGLTTKQGEAKIRVRELKREYQDLSEQMRKGHSVANVFAKGLALLGGTYALKRLGSEVVSATGQIQMLNVSFRTLLQSKEKADAVMSEIIQTAVTTPFQLTELASGAKQLIAYGFAAEEVNGTLIRLGNVASALGLPLERLTYLYGTTRTQGRLYARDLLQFTTSGIPMLQGLADMYGKSTEQVNKMVSAGKIGFPEVQKVIEQMTNKGGKFYNLMQEQAKTIPGQISNLQDSFTMMFNDIGQSQSGLISGTISLTKALVDNYDKVGKVIVSLIATYGAYSAAVLIAAAANGTLVTSNNRMVVGFVAARKAIVGMTTALMANPYAAAAAAIFLLVGAIWTFTDTTSAAQRAQEDLNEAMEGARGKRDEITSDAERLVRKLRAETSSVYEQVEAWDELIRKYEFFAKYTIDDLKKMTDKELAKVLSSFSTGTQEKIVTSLYEQKKADYEGLLDKIKSQSDGTAAGAIQLFALGLDVPTGVFGPTTRKLIEEAKVAKAELEGLEKEIKRLDGIREQADFQSLPEDKRRAFRQSELDNLKAEKDKLESINPDWQTDKQRKRLKDLVGLITNAQAEVDKFKANSQIRDEAYWDKQKKEAEEALKAIDSAHIAILEKASPTALKSGNVAGVDPLIVESYRNNKSLLEQASGELERFSFGKNGKKGENLAKQMAEAQQRLDKKLKEDRLSAELEYQGAMLAIQMDGYDKQLRELKLELDKQNAEIEKRREEALDILAKSKNKKVSALTEEEKAEVDATYNTEGENARKVFNSKKEKLDKDSAKAIKKIWQEATDAQLSDNERELNAINDKYDELIRRAKEAGATLEELNAISAAGEKAKVSASIDQAMALIDFEESVQTRLAEYSKNAFDQQNAIKRRQIQANIDAANERVALLQGEEATTGKDNSQEIQKWLNVVLFSKKEMERLKDNYFVIAEALGSALSQSSDAFVAKMGAMLSSVGAQLGSIQQANVKGDTFGKVSGVVSLAITLGNYLKEIRLWSEGRAIESQRKVTEQVARRAQFENEINKIIAERQAMESEGVFTGKDYEKILTNNLALLTSQSDALGKTLKDLYGNAIFSADGEAKRNLFGTKKGNYEFSLLDILRGNAPDDGKNSVGSWLVNALSHGLKYANQYLKDGDWLGTLGSLLDPFNLFGGGNADKKAKLDAFNNLSSAVSEAMKAMGKSVSDFANMSNEEMLTFFELMEKSGHITDEATKKLLATAKEQLEAAKEAEEKIKEVIKSLAGSLGDDLKKSLIDNFREGFAFGEKTGLKSMENLRKGMNEVLEEMLTNKIFQAAFGGIFSGLEEDMKKSYDEGGDRDWMDDFARALELIPNATEMFNKGLKDAQEQGKNYGFDLFGKQRTGSSLSASMASQGSVDTLAGVMTSTQGGVLSMAQLAKDRNRIIEQLKTSIDFPAMQASLEAGNKIATQNRDILAQSLKHLKNIDENTYTLHQVSRDMGAVKTGIESINTKGVILRK